MRDSKLSSTGFKYPDRVFGPKYQTDLSDKPAFLNQLKLTKIYDFSGFDRHARNGTTKSQKCMQQYTKFGNNLGPQRPIKPVGKFTRYEQK